MSHQETIERMNAELNTSETWSQRWQVEREHNERLLKQASMAREGVRQLRARAVDRYTHNQQYASDLRAGDDPKRADVYERMCIVQSGMVRALDDVLQLFDQIEHIE
jgi:hypothetical protein